MKTTTRFTPPPAPPPPFIEIEIWVGPASDIRADLRPKFLDDTPDAFLLVDGIPVLRFAANGQFIGRRVYADFVLKALKDAGIDHDGNGMKFL